MRLPAFRPLVFAALVLGVGLIAPNHVHAQDCGGGGGDSSGGDNSGGDSSGFDNGGGSDNSGDSSDSGSNDASNEGDNNSSDPSSGDPSGGDINDPSNNGDGAGVGVIAVNDGTTPPDPAAPPPPPPPPEPINITINAYSPVYDQSPTSVSTEAWTNYTPIMNHLLQVGDTNGNWWPVAYSGGGSGTDDNFSTGVIYPAVGGSPGTYYVQAAATTDGVNWTYSNVVTVTVNPAISSHTVTIQALPKPGMNIWFTDSNVISKTFQVMHTNPYP